MTSEEEEEEEEGERIDASRHGCVTPYACTVTTT